MAQVKCTSALNQGGWRAEVGQIFESTHQYVAAYPGNFSTAITDSSTGTALSAVAAGVGRYNRAHPVTSLATGLGVSAIDLLTAWTPGFKFKIVTFDFVTTVAGTGAAASQVFNLTIGATPLTGGVLTLTLASQSTIGAVTTGTAITALNTGSSAATVSIKMAASGTVFTAGAGYFVMGMQNMDDADAFATILAL